MPDTPLSKEDIRRQMRERRHEVKPEDRMATGKAICKSIVGDQLRLLLRAWRVCIYLSTKHEIPTRYIARAIWDAGRDVCVPAWSRSDEVYKLFAITPTTKLVTGHHGIREPLIRIPVQPWDVDAFILPGLAFDTSGGRLGFGAGHYDALLAQASKRALKVAICYDWQILDEPLPQEPHDIAMDWLISEKRVICCAKNRTAAS